MKFVDEAFITVKAGDGGDGCLSFRREKFIPRGGPDGGDGGDGGDVHLVAAAGMGTLADFRHARNFKAASGRPGAGRNRSGRSGAGLLIKVPPGTVVRDRAGGERIGEVVDPGHRLLVARGGAGGRGNAHFKSATNRAPRRATAGRAGDRRELSLELLLLADAGLVGRPNAGKSTLLRALSRATPKVADYPFTTMHPQLGAVRVDAGRSFVLADIPGLIAGAAAGAGLGIRFLRHLQRTRLLLHLVDMAPADGTDAAAAVREVEAELAAFNPGLARRERWLVLNKSDLLPAAEARARAQSIAAQIGWHGPLHSVSAATGAGCSPLAQAVMNRLEALDAGS